MNFEDIKDKLREAAAQIWSRIEESSLYIQLSEKYSDLNPASQKAATVGAILVAILLVLAVPFGYLTNASENVAAFEEKKDLLRELYRVSRASSELDAAPPTAEATALVSQAQNVLQVAHVPPELIKGVREFDDSIPQAGARPLPNVPKAVQQKGVEVALSKMNLRQVVDLGFQLQGMNRGLKMVGLSVDADVTNPHYYDVVYQLVSFSLPSEPDAAFGGGASSKGAKGTKGKKGPRAGAKKAPTEDTAQESTGG